METVFSHIIQRRLSRVNEDVATDALAFVLRSSDDARRGMMKLLRGVVPNLPDLNFQTQQTKDRIRPDMCGLADTKPRVYIENKFWAGLTDNQPVAYLKQLATYAQPTVLLVIVPALREKTMWQELLHRLSGAGISASEPNTISTTCSFITTGIGPVLAITSWTSLLSVLEHEAANSPHARGDIVQLRALCNAADSDAFSPVSSEQLSDQRIPAFILQLNSIIQATVDQAIAEKVINIKGLNPTRSSEYIGRYVRILGGQEAGAWMGTHFIYWKRYGRSPLWLEFSPTSFGRAPDVRRLIEPWATRESILTVTRDQSFLIALDIPVGEDKERIVRSLVDTLKRIADVLVDLPPITE